MDTKDTTSKNDTKVTKGTNGKAKRRSAARPSPREAARLQRIKEYQARPWVRLDLKFDEEVKIDL